MSSRLDVLCNACPAITLGKLNRLEVLSELYGDVQIPRTVHDEVVTSGLLVKSAMATLISMCLTLKGLNKGNSNGRGKMIWKQQPLKTIY